MDIDSATSLFTHTGSLFPITVKVSRQNSANMLAMALVTYVLLCGLASGLQSRFHPEVLGASFFKAIAVIIMEFCIIKLGTYLLDVRGGGASGVELIGYGGYKFVGYVSAPCLLGI